MGVCMKIKNYKWILIGLITILLIFLSINNYGIWTDETYTLNMIKHSYLDIFIIENTLDGTTFYITLLKLFLALLGITSPKNIVVFSRIFSIIPTVLLMVVGSYKIEKMYDKKRGLLFVVMMFVSNIIYYSIEIRTYSWVILFVTLAYIEFLNIYKSDDKWYGFVIYSSLAFWFHKTAVIPLGVLYIFLFFKVLKTDLKKFFYYLFVTIVLCVPWVIYSYLMNVSKDLYVSGAIGSVFTLNKFKETIVFPFDTGTLYLSLGFCTFVGAIVILYLYKNYKDLDYSKLAGVVTLPLTCLCLMLIAYSSNHDYYPKYMLPSLGVLYTSILVMVEEKKFWVYFSIFFVINAITYVNVNNHENIAKIEFARFEKYFTENLNNNEHMIFNFDYGQYIVEYYELEGLKDNSKEWSNDLILKDNSVYFIQTERLNSYFKDTKYEVIDEFNISNDLFSLCKIIK